MITEDAELPIKPLSDNGALTFWYKNYKGEEGYRRVRPVSIRFGSSDWHKEPQWLMLADDLVNGKRREFAMKDMNEIVGTPTIYIHAVLWRKPRKRSRRSAPTLPRGGVG